MTGFCATPQGVRCVASGRDYHRVGGVIDFVPGVGRSPTPAQRLMETPVYALGYEQVFRPSLTRLVSTQPLSAAIELALAMLDLRRDALVLDVGCGTGNFTRPLAHRLAPGASGVVGLDLSPSMLRSAETFRRTHGIKNVRHVRGDAQRLPIADASMDAVLCAASLQLMPEPWTALREFARVLKPGARLVLGTFIASPRGTVRRMQRVLAPVSGFTWFDAQVLTDRLEECGLRVCEEMVEGAAISIAAVREPHTTKRTESR